MSNKNTRPVKTSGGERDDDVSSAVAVVVFFGDFTDLVVVAVVVVATVMVESFLEMVGSLLAFAIVEVRITFLSIGITMRIVRSYY